ncbi:hypothetical protein ATO46_05390 [Aeromonas schubertii]|uniref:DUF2956 domain-containing protein n=1 Tax=Aeromonas schubertii TaxID=652 RepID=UPI00067F5037|nr:DUF2956 domain-containing protein [Aeromonas schubertii]KUE79454.1 hypothetical protein ATO46_05390 [Aeromonas schubertii]
MAKYQKTSPETRAEAQRLARANQKPGQTKEQTQLIAQGIQKGIEEYKKQQKAKARDLSRYKKLQAKAKSQNEMAEVSEEVEILIERRHHPLPWLLLLASWGAFGLWLLLR